MLRQQEDLELLDIANEYLPRQKHTDKTAQILAIGGASAAYYRGMLYGYR